ncbi:Holliday junction DNA helicase RuvB [Spiroplasma sp. TIUS-1]|uniref:Holliday junction branch migration DNA helicase RuvB n=1 Tax=Spiroplasma sp. TIUS-1 TaxID=216963 RepID=UPI001397CE49|nr:Holliday junction branch migration DNA helicase RuvB [Spiroplasma sp. TIUS-1]QHX35909.1 Holliday junction DNA helicase RuvB [Spiroplasma sp. TIUS-1]
MKLNNIFRPKKFVDFIGQKQIINNLQVFIESAKKQSTALDHVLFFGTTGCGKTSLSFLIANEMEKKITFINGTTLNKPSDLISPLTTMKENDILFIDEIHAVDVSILEVLYPALEDNVINVMVGKEYNSKVITIKIPKFTLIASTTEIHKIPPPLLNRFPIQFYLKEYTTEEMEQIIKLASKKIKIDLNDECAKLLSTHCKNNPRIAINLIKRVNDYYILENKNLTVKNITEILKKIGIVEFGLNQIDIDYLHSLKNGKPQGVESIFQITGIPVRTLIVNVEPILIKLGLITKTTKGRTITEKGVNLLSKL